MSDINLTNDSHIMGNLRLERQILGKIISENDYYWQVRSQLKPEHFVASLHQLIFANIGELIEAGKNASPLQLAKLEPALINDKPASDYYIELARDSAHAAHVVNDAITIRDFAYWRKFVDVTSKAGHLARAATPITKIEEFQNDFESQLLELKFEFDCFDAESRTIEHVCEESLQLFLKELASEEQIYPHIGLKSVTRLMGPLTPGCLYVIAGRPGSGKTALAVSAARSIMRQRAPDGQNFGVGFVSLEMTQKDIWGRFLACEMALSQTPIEYMRIKRLEVNKTEVQAIERYSEVLKKFLLFIDDTAQLGIEDIFARVREEQHRMKKAGQRLDVIVVDYLQIIKPTGRYQGNKVAEISEISSGLVRLAKELGVAVLAVSQLSRKVEERNDKRPIMSDLRESGQIEQDANGIVMVYRPAYYDNQKRAIAEAEDLAKFDNRKNDLHCIVTKARDGITGEIVAYCDIGKNDIADKYDRPSA